MITDIDFAAACGGPDVCQVGHNMSDYFRDQDAKDGADEFESGLWAAENDQPCSALSTRSPEIALYLNLHCPRCGQLANLSDKSVSQPCLLRTWPASQFHLNGDHHEFSQ